jgi:hypothetical protein
MLAFTFHDEVLAGVLMCLKGSPFVFPVFRSLLPNRFMVAVAN